MRSLRLLCATALVGTLSIACGGSGGGGGGGLTPVETALVGNYTLASFDWQEAGMWTDETAHLPWSGTIALHADGTGAVYLSIAGEVTDLTGNWYADGTTFTFVAPVETTEWTYTFDGTTLVIDRNGTLVGEDEIYRFVVSVLP